MDFLQKAVPKFTHKTETFKEIKKLSDTKFIYLSITLSISLLIAYFLANDLLFRPLKA